MDLDLWFSLYWRSFMMWTRRDVGVFIDDAFKIVIISHREVRTMLLVIILLLFWLQSIKITFNLTRMNSSNTFILTANLTVIWWKIWTHYSLRFYMIRFFFRHESLPHSLFSLSIERLRRMGFYFRFSLFRVQGLFRWTRFKLGCCFLLLWNV